MGRFKDLDCAQLYHWAKPCCAFDHPVRYHWAWPCCTLDHPERYHWAKPCCTSDYPERFHRARLGMAGRRGPGAKMAGRRWRQPRLREAPATGSGRGFAVKVYLTESERYGVRAVTTEVNTGSQTLDPGRGKGSRTRDISAKGLFALTVGLTGSPYPRNRMQPMCLSGNFTRASRGSSCIRIGWEFTCCEETAV